MDLIKNDFVDPATALAAVGTLKSTALAAAKSIRDKKKTKEAQAVADKGQYFTLRPYLKSLIPIPAYVVDMAKDKGISEYAVLQLPEQGTGASTSSIIAALQKMTVDPMPSGVAADVAALRASFINSLPVVSTNTGFTVGTTPVTNPVINDPLPDKAKSAVGSLAPYLPYIIGALAIGLVIYFVTKK